MSKNNYKAIGFVGYGVEWRFPTGWNCLMRWGYFTPCNPELTCREMAGT